MPMQRFLPVVAFLCIAAVPLAAAAGQRVLLNTTMGDITLELDAKRAPKTVENFVRYVKDGAYDGTIFHRVIDGFMIQGGGFDADFGRRDTRAPVINEADNGLKNTTGTVAMARTGDPHSATSQFFINIADNAFLDHRDKTPRGWGYAVFGRVVDGMDVVNSIRTVPTGRHGHYSDVPREPVVITKASLLEDQATDGTN